MAEAPALEIVRTAGQLRLRLDGWRRDGHAIGLVPTMGGLHEGHLALVRRSAEATARTVATLFVNPKQFGPGEDFETYPRDEERDVRLFAGAGAHLVYAPGVEEIYPPGAVTQVSVPGLGDMLEGQCRPGFFTGVATVVAKLFAQAMPDRAFFGEKDFQQLQVIRRMAADLNFPIAIEGVPTVRQDDGLALSSRNAYLSKDERKIAPALYGTIRAVAERVAAGGGPAEEAARGERRLLEAGFAAVDYLTVRDALTLQPVPELFGDSGAPARVLAAARLGDTRLIDNVAV